MLYARLAYNNLKKNHTAYIPFLLASAFTVILNVIMQVMLHNKGMDNLPQADSVKMMFSFGNLVITIFSVIFIFYTHSFLIKRRKKELGLYNILGMDKWNLTLMMLFENLYTFLLMLVSGLLLGIVVSKLMFLVLKRLTGFGAAFTFSLSFDSVVKVTILFLVIFFATFLYDILEVRKAKPIELMSQSKSGEKEPKAKWIFAIIGLICLGAGYTISLTIKSPVDALAQFFVAVVLVIVGTYSLFIAGSITLLKVLKHNEGFYYKPSNFISVSSMIFRMKQNGAGLATICILCTMTLVTISTTICLYVGREGIIAERNPAENAVDTVVGIPEVEKMIDQAASQERLEIHDLNYMTVSKGVITKKAKGDVFKAVTEPLDSYQNVTGFKFIRLSDYNRLEDKNLTLSTNGAAVYPVSGDYTHKTITIGSQTFQVEKVPDNFVLSPKTTDSTMDSILMIVPDDQYQRILDTYAAELTDATFPFTTQTRNLFYFELSGTKKQRMAAIKNLREQVAAAAGQVDDEMASVSSIDEDREENKMLMGGFLFIGIIFGISFLVATALIIFYKQISEGTDDRDRFAIMQKVGLSHKEVKRTIQHQILLVFFLPITFAVIHLAFAFPIIKKMLVLFGLVNGQLLLLTTIATVSVFVICYLIIYWRTSKVYYQLVERT